MHGDTTLVQIPAVMLSTVFDGGSFYREPHGLRDTFIKIGPGQDEDTFLVRNERTLEVESLAGTVLAYPTQ